MKASDVLKAADLIGRCCDLISHLKIIHQPSTIVHVTIIDSESDEELGSFDGDHPAAASLRSALITEGEAELLKLEAELAALGVEALDDVPGHDEGDDGERT